MKFNIIFLMLIGLSFAQERTGINTTTPTRTLDVNGNLRVEKLDDTDNNASYDRILVSDSESGVDQGNVDYKTLAEVRKNIFDLRNLTSNEIYELRRKLGGDVCIKGTGGQDYNSQTKEGKIVEFPDVGIQFRVAGAGPAFPTFYVEVKSTTESNRDITLTELGGSLSVPSNTTLTSNWKNVGSLDGNSSQSGEIFFIIKGTAQTFKISLVSKDVSFNNSDYSLCVKQTVL